MADIKEVSYAFEAVKSALRQTKDGITISLVIHPNDVPNPLLSDPVGSRYMVGMARLGDDGEPIESEEQREARRSVISAGALCRDTDFQKWIMNNGFSDGVTEEDAANAVRNLLDVKSRSEIRTNPDAQRKWRIIRNLFIKRSILMETDLG